MSDSVIDMNMVAIYVMVRGDPGIKRARLYKAKHGQEIFERMVAAGLIREEEGNGCYLTEDGERIGVYMREIVKVMGEEQQVEEYISGLIEWYQGKIDKNRIRNR